MSKELRITGNGRGIPFLLGYGKIIDGKIYEYSGKVYRLVQPTETEMILAGSVEFMFPDPEERAAYVAWVDSLPDASPLSNEESAPMVRDDGPRLINPTLG